MLTEKFLNGSHHIHCLATPADTNGQASTTKIIDTIEELQIPAIHRLIKPGVKSPPAMRVFGSQQHP